MMAQNNSPSLPVLAERLRELGQRHAEYKDTNDAAVEAIKTDIKDIQKKFDKILYGALGILLTTLGTLLATLLKH